MTKTFKTLILVTAAAGLAAPAFAQGVDPALDTNADGMLSFPEVAAGYPEVTEETFTQMDTTGDGLLDVVEVADAVNAGLLPPAEG